MKISGKVSISTFLLFTISRIKPSWNTRKIIPFYRLFCTFLEAKSHKKGKRIAIRRRCKNGALGRKWQYESEWEYEWHLNATLIQNKLTNRCFWRKFHYSHCLIKIWQYWCWMRIFLKILEISTLRKIIYFTERLYLESQHFFTSKMGEVSDNSKILS